MPLNGHSYLVSQGWSGSGTGLREGAISRPLAIPQKKNLAGLGKNRDEAFPFWDHVYSTAAKSIQVKFSSHDGKWSDKGMAGPSPLMRTPAGILSGRRPCTGVVVNPHNEIASTVTETKRKVAREMLYSKFFRGPILGEHDYAQICDGLPASCDVTAVDAVGKARRGVNRRGGSGGKPKVCPRS